MTYVSGVIGQPYTWTDGVISMDWPVVLEQATEFKQTGGWTWPPVWQSLGATFDFDYRVAKPPSSAELASQRAARVVVKVTGEGTEGRAASYVLATETWFAASTAL